MPRERVWTVTPITPRHRLYELKSPIHTTEQTVLESSEIPMISKGGRCLLFSISSLLKYLLSTSTLVVVLYTGFSPTLARVSSNDLYVSRHLIRQSLVCKQPMK